MCNCYGTTLHHIYFFSFQFWFGQTRTYYIIFFFQAEDGIRDYKVTGVQTCALPISTTPMYSPSRNIGTMALVFVPTPSSTQQQASSRVPSLMMQTERPARSSAHSRSDRKSVV